MSTGLILATAGPTTSSSNGPSLANLWAPPVFGAGLAAVIVILAGIFAWGMSSWPKFRWWLGGRCMPVSRFTRAANHQAASGEIARHARSSEVPPANPMPIEEARGVIGRLVGA
jgi:hypothetical protein